MGIFSSIPLLFTPNSTNSGIVNKNGPLVHGNSTTFSGSQQNTLETTQSFGPKFQVPPDMHFKYLGHGTGATAKLAKQNTITTSRTYLPSTIQIYSLDTLLNFTYGNVLQAEIKSAIKELEAYLNVISIEDIIGYIVTTQQTSENLSAFVRVNLERTEDISALLGVVVPYQLFQLFTKGDFVYAAVQKGIEIFDIHTGSSLYVKEVPYTRIKTIWGNDTTLYFGGEGGLFYIDYANLHNDFENSTISGSFPLKSQIVRYIHGKDNSILVTTSSGVEYFNWSNNPTIKSRTYIENSGKCFLTTDAAYYFTNTTISGEPYWTLNKKQNLITDWEQPTKTFNTGDTFTLSTALTDIYVTEGTTLNGNNTIFCATTSGIYVIDEDENKKVIYYTRQ